MLRDHLSLVPISLPRLPSSSCPPDPSGQAEGGECWEFTLLPARGNSLAQPGDTLPWGRRAPPPARRGGPGNQRVTTLTSSRKTGREKGEAAGGAGLSAGRAGSGVQAVPRVGSGDRPVQRRGENSLRTRARLLPGSRGEGEGRSRGTAESRPFQRRDRRQPVGRCHPLAKGGLGFIFSSRAVCGAEGREGGAVCPGCEGRIVCHC